MFIVIFEVRPKPEHWDDYLHHAGLLRPELVKVDGFIDNVRYKSQRHSGLVLSLSTWRDEKALVRWRTHALHHDVQRKGRFEVFADYHLRVGEITADTHIPAGHALVASRFDETETGPAKAVTIMEPAPDPLDAAVPPDGLVEWDLFEPLAKEGDRLLLRSWRDAAAAASEAAPGARHRRVRVIRDYGMFARAEAPQYYPDVPGALPPAAPRNEPDRTRSSGARRD